MPATKEQMDYFRWLEKGTGNGLLEAEAGSGKTTSIIQGLDYMDDEEPVLLCSFTNLIAKELASRVAEKKFTNVTSSTLNSVGWSICRKNFPTVKLDQFKTRNILKAQLENRGPAGLDVRKLFDALKYPADKLIGLLKGYVVQPADYATRVKEISDYHSVELPEGGTDEAIFARKNFYEVLQTVYSESVHHTQNMDFNDQKFMPVFYDCTVPFEYAFIIVDEAQDCNDAAIQLIEKIAKKGYKGNSARVVAVGDSMQAIYLFTGALNNAMEIIKDRFDAHRMPLTVCWRCPELVIEEAKKTSPTIQGPTPNANGVGSIEHLKTSDFIEQVQVGDFVICRTTAPLVKRCLQLVRQGIPAKVKGREIGRGLIQTIEKIAGPNFNMHSLETLSEFVEKVDKYKTETVTNLEKAGREETAIRITDECEAIVHFCMEAANVAAVISRIDAIFTDEGDDKRIVLFLTGHKSKGLQNPVVWFLRPDLCPHPKAKKPHDMDQETHLRHIIVTRSQHSLYFVAKEDGEK